MEVTDRIRHEIHEWAKSAGRMCPNCKATPGFFEVTEIDDDAVHPNATGPQGIDTSMRCHLAMLRCTKCGFDGMTLVLEDIGLV